MNRNLATVLAYAASGPPSVREAAERLKPKRRPRKNLAVGRMKPSRMDLAKRTTEVYDAVRKRAEGKCELCGQPEADGWRHEMHHLLMGSGKRRQDQDPSNCLMVCPMCHAIGHRRILMAGPGLLAWAAKYGYTRTAEVIQRRIDKALRADPAWPRNEDETRRLGPDSIPRDPQHEARARSSGGGTP